MNKDRNAKAHQGGRLDRNMAIKVVWFGWMRWGLGMEVAGVGGGSVGVEVW